MLDPTSIQSHESADSTVPVPLKWFIFILRQTINVFKLVLYLVKILLMNK